METICLSLLAILSLTTASLFTDWNKSEILREVSHARPLAVRQRAALQPKVTAERSQEGGFARAVWTDDEPPVAAAHLETGARDERL